MAVSMLDNISYKCKKADNVRSYFETIADMVAFSENYLPDVYITLCGEDNNQYKFVRSNEVDPVLGKWRLLESGGGADLTNYYTKTQVDNKLSDKVDVVSGKQLSTEDYTTEEKTKLASLENYDDTALDNRITANENAITVLNGDTTVNGSVDKKVASCLSDSKDYTDTSIQNAIRMTAIACDAKPSLSGTTITYVKDGTTYTMTSDNKTKFYYTDNSVNYSTIWIDGKEFTDTVASVNFSDYVSKTNDVISTYTGSDADKTKIPNIGAMDALKTLVDTDLNDKLDIANIESNVSSSSDNPVKSSVLYTEFGKKVDIAQGVANEGKILKVNSSGNLALVDPSAMGSDSVDVNYTNAEHSDLTNVKLALDNILNKIYYVPIAISSMSVSPSTTTYEVGMTISELVFTWIVNKTPTSQTFNGNEISTDLRTYTYDTSFSSNKTFTLNVSDGQQSSTKSISINFQNKIYWGSSSTASDFDSAFILGLANSKFSSTNKGTFSGTAGSGEYFYLCYPSTMQKISTWFVGGFETDAEDCGTISFTNSSGGVSTYCITRTTRSGLGSINIEVK